MKTYASLLTLALVSGCASTQVAQNECQGAGYAPGTVGYASCYERSLERQQATSTLVAGTLVGGIAGAAVAAALTPPSPPQPGPVVFNQPMILPAHAPALPQRHYQHDFTATIGPRGYRNR